jgi:NADH-quinone oxidoreductase subunit M
MTAMGGYVHAMPGMAAFFVIAGLSSLGLPGLAGFVAEFLVFLGAWTSAHPWWLVPAVAGAFITALYVLHAVKVIFHGPPTPATAHIPDARGVEWCTLVVLSGLLIAMGMWPRLVLDPISVAVRELVVHLGLPA